MLDSNDTSMKSSGSRSDRSRWPGRTLRLICWISTCVAALLVLTNIATRSSHTGPVVDNLGSGPATEPLTAIAARYSPYIYHATEPAGGRQDIISNIDFDGDLVGNNNWE